MRADRIVLSVLSAFALATITVPVGTAPAEAQIQKHQRAQRHAAPRKPSARRHHVPRQRWAAPPYRAAPGGYAPVPRGGPSMVRRLATAAAMAAACRFTCRAAGLAGARRWIVPIRTFR